MTLLKKNVCVLELKTYFVLSCVYMCDFHICSLVTPNRILLRYWNVKIRLIEKNMSEKYTFMSGVNPICSVNDAGMVWWMMFKILFITIKTKVIFCVPLSWIAAFWLNITIKYIFKKLVDRNRYVISLFEEFASSSSLCIIVFLS